MSVPTSQGGDGVKTTSQVLGSATYEVIRQRLQANASELRERSGKLDARRRQVFGAVEFKLLQSHRITTAHNCVPRDMVQLGRGRFLFGFNVQLGLKKEVELADVFAIYEREEASGAFHETSLDALEDRTFLTDFKRLYHVYEKASFSKFSLIEGHLYAIFQIGAGMNDVAVFKWAFNGGRLRYLDGRSESEFRKIGFPSPHGFRWKTPDRQSYRYGSHPHVSIEDRVFVECVGGTLTVKVVDNTSVGEGIYEEPVEDKNQKVDDAEIAYSIAGDLVVLKIRPYKESAARYFVFNGKQQSVVRVDSIGQSCVFLPEDHGLIFPDGYYLATGGLKRFESRERDLVYERTLHASNGEDSLYVFYNRMTGEYVLLPYRLIAQKVEERISCHGFCLFPDGHLLLFRADDEAQRHHTVQLRQTPYHLPGYEPQGQRDSYLYQVGNKEVVRCLAECNELLTLLSRDRPYAELYADVVKRCGGIVDSYPWLRHDEAFHLDDVVRQVRETADKAVEEFDKVRRLQREATAKVAELRRRAEERFQLIRRSSFKTLDDYVKSLGGLRQLRGEIIGAKEVRYVDLPALDELEKSVIGRSGELARSCVAFLLQPQALEPYRLRAAEQAAAVEKAAKVSEARQLELAVVEASGELEMLIETVNGLEIADATEATRIIDGITTVYATLNQVRAALKNRMQSLAAAENAAQFAAQMKLLGQTVSSYLELCETPPKCDDYLNRISVQLEELEGTFAQQPDYAVELAERRTSIYEAFEQRKVSLVEARNRQCAGLMTAAERMLKSVQNRLSGFQTAEQINTYMAADPMVAKVRGLIQQMLSLEDSVKADDLTGRLKSLQQEALRQQKDKQELFLSGSNVIQLGRHQFNVNTQALELTMVNRDGQPALHLASTKYFSPVDDPQFLATRDAWDQEIVSETPQLYRGEFLAVRLWEHLKTQGRGEELIARDGAGVLELVQQFTAPRYSEGYTKGVHDLDGAALVKVLAETERGLGLARYAPGARACALCWWTGFASPEIKKLWQSKLEGFAAGNELFPRDPAQADYIARLRQIVLQWCDESALFDRALANAAGEYLFFELIGDHRFVLSREADEQSRAFKQVLVAKGHDAILENARAALAAHPESELELIRDWIRGFLLNRPDALAFIDEIAAALFCEGKVERRIIAVDTRRVLERFKGVHPLLKDGRYDFDYLDLQRRVGRHDAEIVPRFQHYQAMKQRLLEKERKSLRLDEFRPRVLGSFVRNQLIDQVYLPLIGDNLAKQIGAAGEAKRTDLMGLLLLISPPGYGKTTLMEYLASRLGIVFIKVNGPALGHEVTSLDPETAPNAAARQELTKLNLALEMGDNVMLCVDDIQHCNPEFLQKFISLCDGQRKIEGVWRGQPRTYDLRGRKFVVVMAGNPYTENGQKFKIPDMLANRADTYNLGDIIGGSAEWFKDSYIENAATSNTVLAPVAGKFPKDIRGFIRLATTGQRELEGFEGSYSAQEVEEITAVMRKLVAVREIVLKVNLEYIHSAAQADDFRTEPPFRLQGSYRNMNRLAEKVAPIMNEAEVSRLILDHYRGESQTLTTGAEANLLKFKELIGVLSAEEALRWKEIKQTFQRNQVIRSGDHNDPMGRVVSQLVALQSSLQGIREALQTRAEGGRGSVSR